MRWFLAVAFMWALLLVGCQATPPVRYERVQRVLLALPGLMHEETHVERYTDRPEDWTVFLGPQVLGRVRNGAEAVKEKSQKEAEKKKKEL